MALSRVLVVEDDDATRQALVLAIREWARLSKQELQVLPALDATHALRSVAAIPPAVIVLDLALPNQSDGQTIVETMRTRHLPVPPIVVVSGLAEGQEIADGIGATAYFPKPPDFDKLANAVLKLAAA